MKILNSNLKDKSTFYGYRKALIRNHSLSPEARLLLIDLMSYKGNNPNCWPSMGRLSRDVGRNRDSVRKYLRELASNGYLIVKSRGIGRSLLYSPSYWKVSSGIDCDLSQVEKPAEKTTHPPAESTQTRSISSGNKDNDFKTGKELFDRKRKEMGLI